MKKIIASGAAVLLTAAAMTAAIDWGQNDNLASGATVTVSSIPTSADRQPELILDNNNGTSWQAVPATHKYTKDWVIVDLGEVKEFTDIELIWEASHPTSYSVYVSSDAIPFEEKTVNEGTDEAPVNVTYNAIDQEWLDSATPDFNAGVVSETAYTENLTADTTLEGRYILVYVNEYNGWSDEWGIRLFEVRVANIENHNVVTALKVTAPAILEGETAEVTVEALDPAGNVIDDAPLSDIKLVCSNADAVEIEAGESAGMFNVKGLKLGTYTLTATAGFDDVQVSGSATFEVAFNWNDKENVAEGKAADARMIDNGNADYKFGAANATDGNEETYYTYDGEWGGGDAWVVVDLGQVYVIDAVATSYGGVCTGGQYKYSFGDVNAAMPYEDETDGYNFKWTSDNALEGWTSTASLPRKANAVNTYVPETPVMARYIAVRDVDNPGGKPQVKEIYVSGVAYAQPEADEIQLTVTPAGLFVGETAEVAYTVTDQYGNLFDVVPEITVEGADYNDATITATEKGKVTVTATVGDVTATAYVMVADQADYCMADATFSCDKGAADFRNVTDGGANPTSLGGNFQLNAENESAGEHEHWITANLGKPYDLDMVIAIWEGACPADYDVYLGETEDNLVKAYSVTGHKQATWYDRFVGQDMEKVQYIKIVTTKNATGYGVKLFELKAYGTPSYPDVATTLKVNTSLGGMFPGETAEVSVSVLNQYGVEMEFEGTPEITVAGDGATYADGMLTAVAKGKVVIDAKLGDLTGSTAVMVADKNDYCMAGATFTCDNEEITDFSRLTDGGMEPANKGGDFTLASNIAAGAYEHWLLAKLAQPYSLDMIIVIWEGACPGDYDVWVGQTEDSLVKAYSVTGHTQKEWFDRFSGQEMDDIQYIKIVTHSNATGYGLKIRDLKAYGVSAIESQVTRVELLADNNNIATDETVTLSATVYDQFDAAMEGIDVVYYVDGVALDSDKFQPETTGLYSVVAKAGEISSEEYLLNVVANKDNKIASTRYEVTAEEPVEIKEGNGNIFWNNPTEDMGKSVTFTYAKSFDFTLIKLHWETACASDYTVVAKDVNGNEWQIFEVVDRPYSGANEYDRIYSASAPESTALRANGVHDSANLTGIKSITITPTAFKHNAAWETKLLSVDAYATDGTASGVAAVAAEDTAAPVDVYNVAGMLVRRQAAPADAVKNLPAGVYIVGGKKVIVK